MEVDLVVPEGRQLVQSYGPGRFRVSQIDYRGSILVLPERTLAWSIVRFDAFRVASLQPVFEAGSEVELVLIGCGVTAGFVRPALTAAIREHHLAVETMTTPAACRTYNVLAAEGRLVAAALIAMPDEVGDGRQRRRSPPDRPG